MSEQPKPCPFCGWRTIVDEPFLLPNKHVCKCNACGARTRICRTWEDAVKLWNMREGAENSKECHKPQSLYYRAFCEERKDSAYCDGCEFWY